MVNFEATKEDLYKAAIFGGILAIGHANQGPHLFNENFLQNLIFLPLIPYGFL